MSTIIQHKIMIFFLLFFLSINVKTFKIMMFFSEAKKRNTLVANLIYWLNDANLIYWWNLDFFFRFSGKKR